MRALVLNHSEPIFNKQYEPKPAAGQIPIRVLKAGLCETDLQLVQGYMGFQGVLGHEFVGIAESGRYAGQRVVGEINCACHNCPECRRELPSHCRHRTVLGILNHDGAFADRLWLPEENLHPVPDSVSDEAAVFTEPLAAAFQIPAQVPIHQFEHVLILGDGRLGDLCAQVLSGSHKNVLVVGKHADKLQRLKSLGIETAHLSEVTETRVADLVVDCTGSREGLEDACRLVRPRGTIVLKTTLASPHGPSLAPVVIDEISVIGSRCGPFAPALQALKSNSIVVENLVTSRFPLEQGIAALFAARQKSEMKVLLEIGTCELKFARAKPILRRRPSLHP